MSLLTRSQSADGRMVITTSQCYERASFGPRIYGQRLSRQTWQSVWRFSKSQGLWELMQFTTVGWIFAPMQQSPENSQSKTGNNSELGTLWMLSRSPKGTWCDYCKLRWGTDSPKGRTQAVWTITSKRAGGKLVLRHYCHNCAMEVQTWHDGTIWTLKDQIDYAKGMNQLDVQPE